MIREGCYNNAETREGEFQREINQRGVEKLRELGQTIQAILVGRSILAEDGAVNSAKWAMVRRRARMITADLARPTESPPGLAQPLTTRHY